MSLYFTSDHHFGHQNIIKFANRPFESVDEMDEVLITKWNETVRSNDSVYYVGDLGVCRTDRLREILKSLNGSIYLITGNHDKSALSLKNRFEWIKDYYELKVDDPDVAGGRQKIILFHYAIRQWNNKREGSFHLYGHSHGKLEDVTTELSFDIGVDCHDFFPLSYSKVTDIMSQKDWSKQLDQDDSIEV